MGAEYAEIVTHFLFTCAEAMPDVNDIRTEVVIDHERGHYEILEVGWDGERRIHNSIIHIDIIEDKVWLQHNATEIRVAEELVAQGIARQAIVIGFHPPRVRQLTAYAVA